MYGTYKYGHASPGAYNAVVAAEDLHAACRYVYASRKNTVALLSSSLNNWAHVRCGDLLALKAAAEARGPYISLPSALMFGLKVGIAHAPAIIVRLGARRARGRRGSEFGYDQLVIRLDARTHHTVGIITVHASVGSRNAQLCVVRYGTPVKVVRRGSIWETTSEEDK